MSAVNQRVVARVVLPVDGDLDVLPHVDGEHVPAPAVDDAPAVPVASTQHPDQVLGRRAYRLAPGQRASFATYFNAFPAGYWRRWTVVDSVTLRVWTRGEGTLIVYRSTARGATARVGSYPLSGTPSAQLTCHSRVSVTAAGTGSTWWPVRTS